MKYFIIVSLILLCNLVAGRSALALQLQIKPYTFKANSGQTVQAEWGTLEVPLKHGVKNGETIELSFVRFQSTNPDPGYPIVYLAGGPGGSGIAAARGKRFPMSMALRKVADVVVLDQRGTGSSNPTPTCSATKLPPHDMTRAKITAYFKSAMRHCITFWHNKGVDLSAYNTRENALDLKTLRKALGVTKLNLLGISYGSTLALAALKVMPEHINRVVIASPLSMSQTARLPARTQDFLERVAALLRSSSKYSHVYPNLLVTMKTVLDRLADKPVQITLHSRSGEPLELTLTRFMLRNGTLRLLKDPRMLRLLPVVYSAMAAGHFLPVMKPMAASLSHPLTLQAMGFGVTAASCLSPQRKKLIHQQAKTALLGNAMNYFDSLIRKISDIEPLDRDFCQPVHSDVPVLVLTGTLDGRTYPAGHEEILENLPNGSEVVIKNAGHDLFMSSPKVTKDIVAFFSHRPVKYRRIKIPPPDFITPAEMRAHRKN